MCYYRHGHLITVYIFQDDGDLVRCFQCGIGLKDFSEDDDPMLEHVRHSSRCTYLPEVLGETGLEEYRVGKM